MPQIQVLSPHVADLIAAGEVVERPASAVKELLENAVDAGARTIVLDIRSGGRGSIRVTDDGCGMSPEDAGVCFLRHATSKLQDEHGLEAIGTLGFRGEALAAISSVSRITLTTREHGAPSGVRVELTAGDIDSMEEIGCPEGTTIVVRDLFYNTPARQKFLGSDRSEGLACVQAALNCALGRPEVSVRCLRDGQEEFFSPGDGKAESAVYALLGRDFAKGLRPVRSEQNGVTAVGFVSDPAFCRGNRSGQHLFVNGRPIRSRALQTALEQAYKNAAMVGKFPACILYLSLPNGLVDVNVHPTKAEVKFAREKDVFDAVYYGALSAVAPKAPAAPAPRTAPAAVPSAPQPAAQSVGKAVPKKDFFRTMDAAAFRRETGLPAAAPARPAKEPASAPARPAPTRPTLHSESRYSPAAEKAAAPVPVVHTTESEAPSAEVQPDSSITPPETTATIPEPAAPPARESLLPEVPEQNVVSPEFREIPFRFIGEALNLYILVEQEDKLCLIDKHAAHERILFDRLRNNEQPLMSQELLLPETFSPTADGLEVLAGNLELLSRLGFTLEPFGETSFVIRAIPADVDAAAAVPLLEELVEKLIEGRRLTVSDIRERLAATIACKAAIKAGYTTDRTELEHLVRRVLSGEVRHCPHGRPVMTVFSRSELDKLFGRIV